MAKELTGAFRLAFVLGISLFKSVDLIDDLPVAWVEPMTERILFAISRSLAAARLCWTSEAHASQQRLAGVTSEAHEGIFFPVFSSSAAYSAGRSPRRCDCNKGAATVCFMAGIVLLTHPKNLGSSEFLNCSRRHVRHALSMTLASFDWASHALPCDVVSAWS